MIKETQLNETLPKIIPSIFTVLTKINKRTMTLVSKLEPFEISGLENKSLKLLVIIKQITATIKSLKNNGQIGTV